MCGFAGVIAWDDRYRVSHETLRKMSAAIAHRGPDGEGSHINHNEEITPEKPQVALAFRRLAILDPDPRSNQPFTDGRHWLVFNGEIYNFRELKKELSTVAPNYDWRTTGDTEVLLRAYAVWSEKCVEHLNGMFAFAVWDEVEKSLFLARDRMGQKPLYVALLDETGPVQNTPFLSAKKIQVIAFSSELSSLAFLPWIDRSVKAIGLSLYLGLGYPTDGTIYTGVGKVNPSTYTTCCHAGANTTQYFFSYKSFRSKQATNRVSVESTGRLVRQAVSRQLVSDVPIGCFLSGGMDSSIIAAGMRATVHRDLPVHTFSLGFADVRYDERKFAASVARHLGTEHHEFSFPAKIFEDLPRLAQVFGEPFADSSALPTHFLSEATRPHVKVALSGDGGDELFGGYERYQALQISERFPRPMWYAPILANLVPGMHPKSVGAKLRRFLRTVQLPAGERYTSYVEIFDQPTICQLFGWPENTWVHRFAKNFTVGLNGRPLVPNALAIDRYYYLPNDLLTKVDRCSMLHGLEVRSPFMDHELVQFAAGLTTDQLLKGGPKRMLREAFKDELPAWVFKRKKMGFAVPIGEWFRGELRAMLRDTLFSSHAFGRSHFDMKVVERLVEEHESKRVDHSQRLYALLMLELWWDTVR